MINYARRGVKNIFIPCDQWLDVTVPRIDICSGLIKAQPQEQNWRERFLIKRKWSKS